VHAETENPKDGILSRRNFTIVVLPEPEGAEKIMALAKIEFILFELRLTDFGFNVIYECVGDCFSFKFCLY